MSRTIKASKLESAPVPNEELERPRQLLVTVFLLVAAWYLTWRLSSLNSKALLFSWVMYAAEAWGMVTTLLHLFMTWRLSVRQASPPPANLSVDVFIPTINEPVDIVRRTLLASIQMDYPHKTWLLDDGNRMEMAALAKELHCHYLARGSNADAKAGNLNYALSHSQAQFIAIFDADHAPKATFLTKTLGFFSDPKVAFVQTPQDFYNLDSFQHRWNRRNRRVWTEQSLFFRVIQRGKDYWNAAFFCGSCALIRRSSLDAIGGFATGTVTEDLHTSIRLHKKGFRSVYYAESLAFGLAPATVSPFIRQRVRWGQGAMQVWRQEGILFCRGLTTAQKVNYAASMMTYFDGWQKSIFYLAPVVVMLTGTMPINALNGEFLVHFIPYYVLTFLAFEEVGRGFGQTLYIEQYNLARFAAFMWATVGLFKRNLKFKVTGKTRLQMRGVNLYTLPQVGVLVLNLCAILLGSYWSATEGGLPAEALAANIIWAGVNCGLALLLLTFNRSVSRFKRTDYRFPIPAPACITLPSGERFMCVADELSAAGARLTGRLPNLACDTLVSLVLYLPSEVIELKAQVRWPAQRKDGTSKRVAMGFQFSSRSHQQIEQLERFLYGSDSQWSLLSLHENMRTPLEWLGLVPTPVNILPALTEASWTPVLYRIAGSQPKWKLGLLASDQRQDKPHTLLSHVALASHSRLVVQSLSGGVSRHYEFLVNATQARYASGQGELHLSCMSRGIPDNAWHKTTKTVAESKNLDFQQAA
jgi:cellulose synthase (UDP-forming)